MVSFDDFKKLELKVAKIVEAEKVEGSEKLVRLQVELGEEKRQILAGIAQFYNTADLIGKKIVIVANLEPRKMMGFESQGMLLAADNNGKPVLLSPDSDVPSGSFVS